MNAFDVARRDDRKVILLIGTSARMVKSWADGARINLVESKVRVVTSAQELRGVGNHAPFVAIGEGTWEATDEGFELAQAVDALIRLGRMRRAGTDDLAELREGCR